MFTVYSQNVGAEPGPGTGDRVRLRWHPEHTFVVSPDGPLADDEEGAAS